MNKDGTIVTIDQGGNRGKFKTIGLTFSLANYKPDYKRAPDLGENNKVILASLGYDPDQIEKLTEEGVISKAQGPKNPRIQVIKGNEEYFYSKSCSGLNSFLFFKRKCTNDDRT